MDSRRNRIQGVLLWDGSAFKRAPGTLLGPYFLHQEPSGSFERNLRGDRYPDGNDYPQTLDKDWTLHLTHTRGSALAVLREKAHSGRHCWNGLCRAGDWKDLFAALQLLPHNPLLLVPSRLADEHL